MEHDKIMWARVNLALEYVEDCWEDLVASLSCDDIGESENTTGVLEFWACDYD
jgi:hypothetical protein